jgi:hypothetical protein
MEKSAKQTSQGVVLTPVDCDIKQFAAIFGRGRTKIFEAIKAGRLRTIQPGRKHPRCRSLCR